MQTCWRAIWFGSTYQWLATECPSNCLATTHTNIALWWKLLHVHSRVTFFFFFLHILASKYNVATICKYNVFSSTKQFSSLGFGCCECLECVNVYFVSVCLHVLCGFSQETTLRVSSPSRDMGGASCGKGNVIRASMTLFRLMDKTLGFRSFFSTLQITTMETMMVLVIKHHAAIAVIYGRLLLTGRAISSSSVLMSSSDWKMSWQ